MTQSKNMIAFYVADVKTSIDFYKQLLDSSPLEQSDNFAMFALPSGLLLGLWLKSDVEPKVLTEGTEGELIFSFEQSATIDELYQSLQKKGIKSYQKPTMLEFGYTFLITDPDGHRIRYLSEPI